MNIFDRTDYEKLEKLDKAVDQIRGRFGLDSIKRASFLESPGAERESAKKRRPDHMTGRELREQRDQEKDERK